MDQDQNSLLRRSVRPKPAPESLLSSPPAIKFYDSYIMRRTTATTTATAKGQKNQLSSSQKKSNIRSDITSTDTSTGASTTAGSSTLKLKLSSSSSSSASSSTSSISSEGGSSKENNLPEAKRSWRVVKLMMPDITEDGTAAATVSNADEEVPSRVDKVKIIENDRRPLTAKTKLSTLPILAPKPKIFTGSSVAITSSSSTTTTKPAKNVQTVVSASASASASKTPQSKVPASVASIVNEDICSACGGLGNFICCDACPRSFHFTCAEPPLDPQNLPEHDWFCCECEHDQQHRTITSESGTDNTTTTTTDAQISNEHSIASLWTKMTEAARKMNPKCFVMPRRFRFQTSDEDLIKVAMPSAANANAMAKANDSLPNPTTITTIATPQVPWITVNEVILDHCGIRAPVISLQKALEGYCHCCGRYGITANKPSPITTQSQQDYQLPSGRPALSCSICPLYWHLDCLDPPMTTFPPTAALINWTCPIHFTSERCLALDIAECLVQAPLLLPEKAIQRQFAHKRQRILENEPPLDVNSCFVPSEEELFFGISDSIQVPAYIKAMY